MLTLAMPWALSSSTSHSGPGHVAVAKHLVMAECVIACWFSVCEHNSIGSVAEAVLLEPSLKDCPDWG